MNKLIALAVLASLVALPALAAKHKVSHPQNIHPQNPYLKHPNHKAHRGRHKKI